ncbi:MAG: hypothetical protein JW737_04020, partial [Acidobacteria bacterium]|nr:hypothetical protein [Acidobacteriota bacterium]
GGGLYLMITSDPTILNCTITGNEAGGNGGGMYSTGNSNPIFTNTILWNDYPNEIQLHPTEPGSPVISYCVIRGGWSGSGSNNINADPKFIDFGLMPSEIPQIYYRLTSGSPCIDAGTSDVGYSFDIDYQQKIDDPVTPNTGGGAVPYYDIGAYEFRARYVNGVAGNDSWDGLRPVWNGGSGPKKTIQAGLNMGVTGEQLIVAPGTYTGTGNRDLNFNGKDLHLLSENGPLQTIIDCQASSSNEHRGILFSNNETPKAFVKGLTIKNGCYTTTGYGGAMKFDNSNPGIFDCQLYSNSARNGGAIDCISSSLTIANCIIRNNMALGDWSQGNGYGGGININSIKPFIKNCLIDNNWAQTHGGGIYCSAASPRIYNSTISGNNAPLGGEAIYIWGSPVITNCIIWDNRIYATPTSYPTVTYSDIESASGEWWFGEGCISLHPYLVYSSPYNACLSQVAAGQSINSPCVDAGSAPVEDVGMSNYSTRTDGMLDTGQVDMGYHSRYSLRIYSMVRGTGSITIYWNGITRVSYVVEWSTDMLSWNPVSVGEVSQWTDTNVAGYTKKFYRVREQ